MWFTVPQLVWYAMRRKCTYARQTLMSQLQCMHNCLAKSDLLQPKQHVAVKSSNSTRGCSSVAYARGFQCHKCPNTTYGTPHKQCIHYHTPHHTHVASLSSLPNDTCQSIHHTASAPQAQLLTLLTLACCGLNPPTCVCTTKSSLRAHT